MSSSLAIYNKAIIKQYHYGGILGFLQIINCSKKMFSGLCYTISVFYYRKYLKKNLHTFKDLNSTCQLIPSMIVKKNLIFCLFT